jgi:NADPH:quinone reductase-like Zn-dependent oxidoreductase
MYLNQRMGRLPNTLWLHKADIALHIPDNLSFEEAATTGVTILTTGRCFVRTIHHGQPCRNTDEVTLKYQKFGIPPPSKPSGNQGQIFVYGGSSAMGTMVIQFAKLCVNLLLMATTVSNHGTLAANAMLQFQF